MVFVVVRGGKGRRCEPMACQPPAFLFLRFWARVEKAVVALAFRVRRHSTETRLFTFSTSVAAAGERLSVCVSSLMRVFEDAQ